MHIFRRMPRLNNYFMLRTKYQNFKVNNEDFEQIKKRLETYDKKQFENDMQKMKENYKHYKKQFKKQFYTHHMDKVLIAASISFLIYFLYIKRIKAEQKKITVNRFQELLQDNSIRQVQIQESRDSNDLSFFQCNIVLIQGQNETMNIPNIYQFLEILDKKKIPYTKSKHNADIYERYISGLRKSINFLTPVLNGLFSISILYMMYKGFSQTKMQNVANKIQPLNIKQKFSDIAGIEEAKKEVMEFVNFLQNPQKFINIGAKIPRGGLLTGPPGTGKTLLAKACAGEAVVPFYYMSGSEFITGYVGQGAKRIQQLFKEAKKNSPSIIFIDELDAIGAKRSEQMGNSEGYNTLNQLLVEMDGFGTNSKVVVFGATNLGSSLDDALVRAGRFDRKIELTLPEKEARSKILDIHMKKLQIRQKDYHKIKESMANLTPGFCGADLENLCNEAAICAVRNNQSYVKKDNFESALERIVSGIQTHNKLSDWQKKKIAYYESAKAVVSWFLKYCDPVMKMSLLSRVKKEKGFSQYFKKDQNLQVEQELIEKIAFLLAGRTCEQQLFKEITSMSQQDLVRAQDLAQKMVTKLGMAENLGYLSLKDDQYKQYSQKTNELIDSEIEKIIKQASNITQKIISEKRDVIEQLASRLIEKEKLDHLEIIDIIGERPYEHSKAYKEYLEEQRKK